MCVCVCVCVCVGGYFQGEGQEKILLCKEGGHYMKNKNIGGDVFYHLNLISKKGPNAKMRKKCKKLSNIDMFFLARFAHSTFYKFIFLEQLTAMPQFNMQNMLFFRSSHHDTNPLLHLYHFRKKYNYILANINSESSRVIFSSFLSSSSGSNIFGPQQIL